MKSSQNVLPGWMVLLVDFIILLQAGILTYFVLGNFNYANISNSNFMIASSCLAMIGLFASYLLKNNLINADENILIESLSVTRTMILTMVIFILISFTANSFITNSPFDGGFTFLFLAAGLSVFGSIFFRMLIRQAMEYLNTQQSLQQKFLIIGNKATASLVQKVISKLGYPIQFIQAYVMDMEKSTTKKIMGAPIYNEIQDLGNIIHKHHITEIVISPNPDSIFQKRRYIDESLKCGIRPNIVKAKDPWSLNSIKNLGITKIQIEDYLANDETALNDQKLYQYINQQTILITGAAGKLGQEICRQLLFLNPAHLVLLDLNEEALILLAEKIKALHLNTAITTVVTDIRNKSRLRVVFERHKPDIVYHAAFFNDPSMADVYSDEAVKLHTAGTKNMVDISKDYEVDRFILISSNHAVNPSDVMGASRRMAELYVRHITETATLSCLKTKFIVVRHGNVLNFNDRIINSIRKEIKFGKAVNIKQPRNTQSFYSVAETSKFILTSSILGHGGETYIFNKDNSIKIVDLVKKIVQLENIKVSTEIRVQFSKNEKATETGDAYSIDKDFLLPTTYTDIFLAVPIQKEHLNMEDIMSQLETLLKEKDNIKLIKFFKTVMPEFLSNNEYAELTYRMN